MRYRKTKTKEVQNVSIHAPARGAIGENQGRNRRPCFNSRTREGCDLADFQEPFRKRFQFTHPRGVRSQKQLEKFAFSVSIHAPARGAMPPCPNLPALVCFNSRTREGCDFRPSWMLTRNWWFQFTHPRGVRFVICVTVSRRAVSIHAPARGAMGLSKRLVIKGLRKA